MNLPLIQTVIEAGILVTLIVIASGVSTIAKTSSGNSGSNVKKP
jgi:hypothetical protein